MIGSHFEPELAVLRPWRSAVVILMSFDIWSFLARRRVPDKRMGHGYHPLCSATDFIQWSFDGCLCLSGGSSDRKGGEKAGIFDCQRGSAVVGQSEMLASPGADGRGAGRGGGARGIFAGAGALV